MECGADSGPPPHRRANRSSFLAEAAISSHLGDPGSSGATPVASAGEVDISANNERRRAKLDGAAVIESPAAAAPPEFVAACEVAGVEAHDRDPLWRLHARWHHDAGKAATPS